MRSRDSTNGRARLMRVATKEGKEGGGTHPAASTHGAQPGTKGVDPHTRQRAPLVQGQGPEDEGDPPPSSARTLHVGRGERGPT